MKNIIVFSVDKDSGIYASTGGHCQVPPYLDFLLSFSSEDNILGFSHLDYDVANLLPMLDLTHKDLERLCDRERLTIAPYFLKYFKGKMFGVDKGFGAGHPYAIFSDLSQYDSELDHVEDRHDADYFFGKAKKAQKIGQEVYDILISLGLKPTSLISPANAYKDRLEALHIPTLKDIPPEASQLAYEACSGNWTEVYKRGHFPQVTDLDINSAYTFQASKLLDLRFGSWKHSSDYQPDATYGYCRCEVSIDSDFSPVAYEYADKQSTPKGIFERSLNKGMIDYVNNYAGYASVLDGWWFYSNSKKRPLEKPIMDLYAEKQKSEGLRKEIVKRVMNGSFYGNFIQTKGGEPADNFCSPWACEIENGTKIQVAQSVLDSNLLSRLISITVDGIVIDGDIPIEHGATNNIGTWRISHKGEAIIVNAGLSCIENKQGEGDFSLSLQELKDLINADPQATQYHKDKLSVITLAMAINSNRLDDLGKIETRQKIITLNDTKRDWLDDFPETGQDLLTKQYNSKPWTIDWLKILAPQKGESND